MRRMRQGSFADATALTTWLSQFDLGMAPWQEGHETKSETDMECQELAEDTWGKGTLKSVDALFREIENEDSQLELWGRHDGVPMPLRGITG